MKQLRKISILGVGLAVTVALSACGSSTSSSTSTTAAASAETSAAAEASADVSAEEAVSYNYMTRDELKKIIDDGSAGYVLIDARKAADYEQQHIIDSVSADMDAAKDGDTESGITNLKAALKTATGNENGIDGDKYVILCYSGNRYANAATELLVSMGIKNEDIYILQGGYEEWTADSNEEYTNLLVQ